MYRHGFTDLVSVVPPGAPLLPSSKLAPSQLGKVPGKRTANGMWAGYDWRRAQHTLEDVLGWQQHGANVGLRADHFPAVDIDCQDEALSRIIEEIAIATLGPAPIRTGKAPKRLLMYRTSEPFGRMRLWIQKGEVHHLVEVLGQGQQYLVHGTHPSTLRAYTWDRDVAAIPVAELTGISRDQVDRFLTELQESLEIIGAGLITREGDGRPITRTAAAEQKGLAAPSIDVLREAVRLIPNDNLTFPDRTAYLKMGYAIRAACGEDIEDGYAIFAEWAEKWEGNARAAGNDPDVVRADWRRMRGPYAVGWSWIAEFARTYGFNDAALQFEVVPSEPTAEQDLGATWGTDQWLAEQVVARQRGRLRFVPQKGKWMVWDAGRWRLDAELLAEDIVKRELKALAVEATRAGGASDAERRAAEKFAKETQAAWKVRAVLDLVRTDRAIAVSMDALDHDPWALNTPGGIVDLKTGLVGPADPDALCTKMASVAPSERVPSRWLSFLAEATGGDQEVIGYLQRLMGYALTGSTQEQHLTFIWGEGGNGKGVFLNVFTGILADYATTAAMDTFTASPNDRHTTDLAALAGARLVSASETQAGKRWDEARVKSLTGGDPITARFMRQDNFTYLPQFKLVFIGNHKPEIRDVGSAMRRRIQLVEFNQRPAVVDQHLGATLREEWPAILHWMIQGCLAWQQQGLTPPASVQAATDDYFAEEDAMGRWLAEETEPADVVESVQSLFAAWTSWTKATNEYTGTLKRFSSALASKGYERVQDGKTRRKGFRGIRIKTVGLEALG